MVKKIFFNAGSQVIGKVVTASVSALIALLIVKSLGRPGFGQYTIISVFVGYFYTFADFGLNTIYIKLSKGEKVKEDNLLGALVGLRIIISILLVITAIIIAVALPYNLQKSTGFSPIVKVGIVILSITIITQALFTSANAYFQKILRYDLSAIASAASAITVLIASALIYFSGGSVLKFTSAYVFGGLSLVVVVFLLIKIKTGEMIIPLFSKSLWIKFLKLSWPVGLALIINLVYFRVDVLILTYVRSTAEVGLYGLAYLFFEAGLTVPIFFANALYPYLTGVHNKDIVDFKKQITFWSKILFFVSILESFGLIIVSFLIPVPFFFGHDFSGSVPALQILALGLPFFFLSALLWHVIIIHNKQKLLLYIYAAGAIFNLITNLIFIPVYGYMAAAVTTVVSEALVMFLLFIVVKRSSVTPIPSLS